LAVVTEVGDFLSPQCSTAREIYFKEENVSASLNIYDMRSKKNKKILIKNESHSIVTEPEKLNRATTPNYIKLVSENSTINCTRENNISP
jgi:hypothetical protein